MIPWVDEKLREWGRHMKRFQDGIGYPKQSAGAYLINTTRHRTADEEREADRIAIAARRRRRRKVTVRVGDEDRQVSETIRYMIPQTAPKQSQSWTWPVEDWPKEVTQIDRVVIDLPSDLREVIRERYCEPGYNTEKAKRLGLPPRRFYEKLDMAHTRLSYVLEND